MSGRPQQIHDPESSPRHGETLSCSGRTELHDVRRGHSARAINAHRNERRVLEHEALKSSAQAFTPWMHVLQHRHNVRVTVADILFTGPFFIWALDRRRASDGHKICRQRTRCTRAAGCSSATGRHTTRTAQQANSTSVHIIVTALSRRVVIVATSWSFQAPQICVLPDLSRDYTLWREARSNSSVALISGLLSSSFSGAPQSRSTYRARTSAHDFYPTPGAAEGNEKMLQGSGPSVRRQSVSSRCCCRTSNRTTFWR